VARGLAILLRHGTLPEVWIPPAELRDHAWVDACTLGLAFAHHGVAEPDSCGVEALWKLGWGAVQRSVREKAAVAEILAGCRKNSGIPMHRQRYVGQHAWQLYDRVKAKKCHGKAAVAVARHLAESSWWILRKREQYRQPHVAVESSFSNG